MAWRLALTPTAFLPRRAACQAPPVWSAFLSALFFFFFLRPVLGLACRRPPPPPCVGYVRIALAVVAFANYWDYARFTALYLAGFLLDAADGYAARLLNQRTFGAARLFAAAGRSPPFPAFCCPPPAFVAPRPPAIRISCVPRVPWPDVAVGCLTPDVVAAAPAARHR